MPSSDAPTRPAKSGPSGRTAVLVLVAAVLVAMLAIPVRSWFLQKARIADAEAELRSAEAAVADLQEQGKQWKDKRFIESQARARLNYVRPGEVGIVLLQPVGESSGGAAPVPGDWIDSLWQTVDSASGRGETSLGEPVQVRPSAPR